ncbi:uncharacterized protein [Chelonus insularis]|uniref:uncharacterized protein n=1 Tax=Chelonus insularis TaxID=460826 RepID=UPI0015893F82|nr:uncharacterized protein LOC118066212 [Chelonus insularis]
MSKNIMFTNSIIISFSLIFLPIVLGYPQDCGCPRGRPQVPLFLQPDNTLYYQQNPGYSTQPQRNRLSSDRSSGGFFQGISRFASGLQNFVANSSPLRRTREVNLPHDVNLQDDVVVRVTRQSDNNSKKLPETEQKTSASQDEKNSQNTKNNNEMSQKTVKKISGPPVPGPRVKISREQKMAADSLLEHEVTPVTKHSAESDIELDEVIPDPSMPGEAKKQLADNSSPQVIHQYADFYREPEVYYYPIKRYAEYVQTPENQIVLIPQAINPFGLFRPSLSYEDLINLQNYGAYDSDYGLEDDVNDSKVNDQVEKPITEEKTQDVPAEKELKSEVDTQNKETNKNASKIKEVKVENSSSTNM